LLWQLLLLNILLKVLLVWLRRLLCFLNFGRRWLGDRGVDGIHGDTNEGNIRARLRIKEGQSNREQ
jgi:hypothetical protein